MMSPLIIVNPNDRSTGPYSRVRRYVLWFGSHGATHLMVYADGLDDALEEAAGWLADNAPGLIHQHDDPYLVELYQEACEELFPGVAETDLEDEQRWQAQEQATADMTYTESGYINSDEWGITLDEHASRAEVKAFIAALAERHYSDEPLVSVG